MNSSAVVRSIVVALDDTESSRAAQEMALRIARRCRLLIKAYRILPSLDVQTMFSLPPELAGGCNC